MFKVVGIQPARTYKLRKLVLAPRRIASRGGARSGWGGEVPRLGALEDTMTTEQKIIRAKVGLLELAKGADREPLYAAGVGEPAQRHRGGVHVITAGMFSTRSG
jgi:hypothetical protein